MKKRLSIIVPTIGRPTLRATLESIAEQWDGEQVIVIAEGDVGTAHRIFEAVAPTTVVDGAPAWMFVGQTFAAAGLWGHNLRNHALDTLVRGTHVATIDDDDVYLSEALDAMADALDRDQPQVYRMTFGAGHPAHGITCWRLPRAIRGDIGTPMIVAPVSEARFGLAYDGDWTYVEALERLYPQGFVWDDRVTVEVRPVAVKDAV